MTLLDVRPLVGRIAEVLRGQIISGKLPPGRKLGQDGVARDLGVSRTPVREAFAVLAAEGWLVHRPRAGVEVTGLLAAEVQEIAVMRLLLEPFAARLHAQAHSADDEDRARALLAQAPPQHTDPDWFDRVEDANREFHFLVYGIGRGTLPELVEAGILHHWDRLARY